MFMSLISNIHWIKLNNCNLRSPVYATQAAYGAQASYPVKTSQIGSQMNEKRQNCNLYNRLTIYVFHAIVETAAT